MSVFSVFGGKNKSKTASCGAYYRALSRVCTAAKYLCLLLCLLVLLYGFSFRTDEINKDNFNYLLNYIDEGEAAPEEYGAVYFDSSEKNSYAIVRGDLAVVNEGGVAVYALSGARRSVDPTLKTDSPQVKASAKYMYIYDIGGSDIVIKSPLETVHTVRYGSPRPRRIRDFAVTDSGYFAVTCEEKASGSSVCVYDDRFRVIYDCSRGMYTLSADINAAADRLLTASVDADAKEGGFRTTLSLYALDSKAPLSEQLIPGECPYKAAFSEGGGFMLLTDKACRFYDKDALLVSTLEFGADGISACDMGKSYFIRQYALSALSAAVRLEVYSTSDGAKLWSRDFAQGVKLAKSRGRYVFVVSGGQGTVLRPESGEEHGFETDGETADILQIDERKALLLSKGSACVLDFGALFEKEENSWAR